jgi:hypothetical protein
MVASKNLHTRKSNGNYQTRRKREENPTGLSLRDREACHSMDTALLQSITDIGIQSTTKSSKKMLHEFSPHQP